MIEPRAAFLLGYLPALVGFRFNAIHLVEQLSRPGLPRFRPPPSAKEPVEGLARLVGEPSSDKRSLLDSLERLPVEIEDAF